jgi:hypothetical protein
MGPTLSRLTLVVALVALGLLVLAGNCLLDHDVSGTDLCHHTSLVLASLVGLLLFLEPAGRFTPTAARVYRLVTAEPSPPPPRTSPRAY